MRIDRESDAANRIRIIQPAIVPLIALTALLATAGGLIPAGAQHGPGAGPDAPADASPAVKRGAYMVWAMGCNDCHTPWKMGANGPEMDMSRKLSGHPEQLQLPPAPAVDMPWGFVGAATMTAWSGPWGTSFTANLTPDDETGLGRWTEQDFVATVRSGRHMGRGRQILPPMPYFNLAALTDEDLHAVFSYLQSIPAVRNRVPEPLPPSAKE